MWPVVIGPVSVAALWRVTSETSRSRRRRLRDAQGQREHDDERRHRGEGGSTPGHDRLVPFAPRHGNPLARTLHRCAGDYTDPGSRAGRRMTAPRPPTRTLQAARTNGASVATGSLPRSSLRSDARLDQLFRARRGPGHDDVGLARPRAEPGAAAPASRCGPGPRRSSARRNRAPASRGCGSTRPRARRAGVPTGTRGAAPARRRRTRRPRAARCRGGGAAWPGGRRSDGSSRRTRRRRTRSSPTKVSMSAAPRVTPARTVAALARSRRQKFSSTSTAVTSRPGRHQVARSRCPSPGPNSTTRVAGARLGQAAGADGRGRPGRGRPWPASRSGRGTGAPGQLEVEGRRLV